MEHSSYIFMFDEGVSFDEVTEFQFAGTAATAEQETGMVTKGILRTGAWPVIPTAGGKIKKPLKIVKTGPSNYDEGIISLEDVKTNFDAGVKQYVQIPLAKANEREHTNATINNTGFVKKVWIEERPEWGQDQAEMMASLDFTKEDVKADVIAGTFADVSSGVPWMPTEGGGYKAYLDHVCITNKPFIRDLSGWMFADDDKVDVSVATLERPASPAQQGEVVEKPKETATGEFFFAERLESISKALSDMNLHGYEVKDLSPSRAMVVHPVAQKTWLVPYAVVDGVVLLATTKQWEIKKDPEAPATATDDDLPEGTEVVEQVAADVEKTPVSSLEAAQEERQRKLTLEPNTGGGTQMPQKKKLLSILEGVELTDEQRAALEAADEEVGTLRTSTREGGATKRIDELKGLGITMPGALKLYRKVFVSDDGGPAAVLLSDDGKETREVKAIEILDLFIDACKGDQGMVQFSDQATDTGNHNKPPKDTTGETAPLEDRVAESRTFLKLAK